MKGILILKSIQYGFEKELNRGVKPDRGSPAWPQVSLGEVVNAVDDRVDAAAEVEPIKL